MNQLFRTLWKDESGQDLAEYGLVIVLIAIAAIGATTALGGAASTGITSAASLLPF